MDYIKSERYRLLRKGELYGIFLGSLGLVIAAIAALYVSRESDPNFPYGSNRFLYLNVLSVVPLIIMIGMLMNRLLLGKDILVMKQTISYGITRSQIFLTKLALTGVAFAVLCLVGILIVLTGGEGLLADSNGWCAQFLIAIVNLIPLVIGAFVLGQVLFLLLPREIYALPIVLFLFANASANLVESASSSFWGENSFSDFFPGILLQQITENYVTQQGKIMPSCFLAGFGLATVSLIVGINFFDKKDI